MKDVTHIERPNLPWRDDHLTECKLDATRHPTWTRAQAAAQARDLGQQRFAMVVCITCMNTSQRHRTWDEDPASCLDRYVAPVWGVPDDEQIRMTNELRAIGLLVAAHRGEFDATVESLATATPMGSLRAARRRRA